MVDKKSTDKEGNGTSSSSPWVSLLQDVGKAVLPTLLTAGGLIGFVAFAGSVIVWTRFSAAQVPPDQVVAAYPRGELVAIASALLLLFGLVGLLAVVAFFLIDPESGGGNGYMRGLLVLLGVEGMVAIFLVEPTSTVDRVLAGELFLLPVIIAFWATFVFERPGIAGEHENDNAADEKPKSMAGSDDTTNDLTFSNIADAFERYLLKSRFISLSLIVFIFVTFVSLLLVFAPRIFGGVGMPGEEVAIVGLAVIAIAPSIYLLYILIQKDSGKKQKPDKWAIPFSPIGQALILILLAVAAIGPSVILGSGWLPFSLATAAVLVAGLWRIAILTREKFFRYALAAFISVPLFGTLTGVFRNIADPQVQPMALIRKADGPDESIQGLYVTETDDRIYFATVSTEGCTGDLVPHSGRLLWVPKSEVVAMSVGPLQPIKDAAKTSLEMSYALTPAVETPGGDHVSLSVAEKPESQTSTGERRLESVGSAVQPNFGAGIRLSPESASPGDIVTVRMSAPNYQDGVEGFGVRREGRTLRLGGFPVDIIKEEARGPFDPEFAEDEGGETVSLEKGILYTQKGQQYVEVHSGEEIHAADKLFVKVSDAAVDEVNDKGLADGPYLRLGDAPPYPPSLAYSHGQAPEVVLDDGTELKLNHDLLRQDWHPDHIEFRVPTHGTTGPVTVECKQLAGQPVLHISRPPLAKISVRIERGSRRIVFDSGESIDDNGTIASRHWWVEGVDRGKKKRIIAKLPPGTQSYSVRLRVTDAEGQTGAAELHLLRLPAHLLGFAQHRPEHPVIFRRARAALRQATAEEPTTAIQFEMRSGEPRHPPSPDAALGKAERVKRALLRATARASSAPANPEGLTVRTMAFSAGCPAESQSNDGRLDILVLGEGVKVVPPADCPIVRLRTAHQLLPSP